MSEQPKQKDMEEFFGRVEAQYGEQFEKTAREVRQEFIKNGMPHGTFNVLSATRLRIGEFRDHLEEFMPLG